MRSIWFFITTITFQDSCVLSEAMSQDTIDEDEQNWAGHIEVQSGSSAASIEIATKYELPATMKVFRRQDHLRFRISADQNMILSSETMTKGIVRSVRIQEGENCQEPCSEIIILLDPSVDSSSVDYNLISRNDSLTILLKKSLSSLNEDFFEASELYPDMDQDGFGSSGAPAEGGSDFTQSSRLSRNNLDCDDSNPAVNPHAANIHRDCGRLSKWVQTSEYVGFISYKMVVEGQGEIRENDIDMLYGIDKFDGMVKISLRNTILAGIASLCWAGKGNMPLRTEDILSGIDKYCGGLLPNLYTLNIKIEETAYSGEIKLRKFNEICLFDRYGNILLGEPSCSEAFR